MYRHQYEVSFRISFNFEWFINNSSTWIEFALAENAIHLLAPQYLKIKSFKNYWLFGIIVISTAPNTVTNDLCLMPLKNRFGQRETNNWNLSIEFDFLKNDLNWKIKSAQLPLVRSKDVHIERTQRFHDLFH